MTAAIAKHTLLTYDWNGHVDMPISGAHLSDFEVAGRVRMLMRTDLNHESVCELARDRIMGLSKEVSRLRDVSADMLDALKAVADATAGTGPVDTDRVTRMNAAFSAARAAVAKAEASQE